MQHYQYHVVDISKLDRNEIAKLLTNYDGEGWEFCFATDTRVYFRKARG